MLVRHEGKSNARDCGTGLHNQSNIDSLGFIEAIEAQLLLPGDVGPCRCWSNRNNAIAVTAPQQNANRKLEMHFDELSS